MAPWWKRKTVSDSATRVHPNAPRLVELARLFAEGIRLPLEPRFPALFAADASDQWSFFCTVACSWTACFTLHHSVSEEDRTPTELRVQEDLIKWHPASLDAFKDLQIFVVERLQSESDRPKRRELLELSIATWIVWNVTQKRPIPREFETVAAVASIIAPEFMNYWQQPLEPG